MLFLLAERLLCSLQCRIVDCLLNLGFRNFFRFLRFLGFGGLLGFCSLTGFRLLLCIRFLIGNIEIRTDFTCKPFRQLPHPSGGNRNIPRQRIPAIQSIGHICSVFCQNRVSLTDLVRNIVSTFNQLPAAKLRQLLKGRNQNRSISVNLGYRIGTIRFRLFRSCRLLVHIRFCI